MKNIDRILQGISLASYETKKVIVDIDILIELKNEIEYLRRTIEAKNKILKQQQSKIKNLTSKLIYDNIKEFNSFIKDV